MFDNFYNFSLFPPHFLPYVPKLSIISLRTPRSDLKDSIGCLSRNFSSLVMELQDAVGLICSRTNPEEVHNK